MRDYLRRCYLLALALCIFVGGVSAAPAKIASVGGTTNAVVKDGKWTGQPDNAPNDGNYLNFQVIPAPNNEYGVDSGSSYDWIIKGSNFGESKGSVWLLDANQNDLPGVKIKIVEWSSSRIRARLNAPHSFTAKPEAVLWVSRSNTKPPPASSEHWTSKRLPVMSMIQSRGYGQCTWYVANRRINESLRIPSPSAYASTGTIPSPGMLSNGFIPRKWDALVYGDIHVAIITSNPTLTNGTDGSITYSFKVGEMNADWRESIQSSTRAFRLSKPNGAGKRAVLQGIGTRASRTRFATAYFR